MLSAIKKLMKSWVFAGFLGLLIITLAFLGLGADPFQAGFGSRWVVKAGSREAGPADFKMFWGRKKQEIEQRFGTQVPDADLVKAGFDKRVLEELMTAEAMAAMVERLGIKAPETLIDEVLKEELKRFPGMFDPITGALNQEAFAQLLNDNGMTEESLRRNIGSELALNHFYGSITAQLEVPRIYSALRSGYALEERDVGYFIVTPESVGPIAAPTEAEMEAFLKANASRLMRPEMRVLQVVRFHSADYQGQITADPAEVQKRFDFRKDALSAPETRSFVQLPAKTEKAAADAAARLSKGEDPAAVAKTLGVEPLVNTDKPRSAIFDKAIGDAAFSLPVGGVSGALKTELGFAVVKVTGSTPARTATLEEHRAEIEKDVIEQAAASKAYAQAEAYDAARGEGASLPQAAAKVGAKVQTIGPIAANGMGADGRPVEGLSKELMETAFALPAGADSDLVELSPGDQFAVRVERIVPPSPPPLAEVREQVSAALIGQRRSKAMQDRAKVASDRLRKGETVAAVAASMGYPVVRMDKATRISAGEHEALGNELLGVIYEGAKDEVFAMPVENRGLVVGRVEAVRPASQNDIARMTEQQRSMASRDVFQDVQAGQAEYVKAKIKPKSNRDRALQALGLDPLEYAEKPPEEEGKGDKAKK